MNRCRVGVGTYLRFGQVLAVLRVAWVADLIEGVYDSVFIRLRKGYSQPDCVLWLSGSERNEAIRRVLDVLMKDKAVDIRSIRKP